MCSSKPQLEGVRGKWTRALSVFNQSQRKPASTPGRTESAVLSVKGGVFQDVRITNATHDKVTITHVSGVATLPIAELTASQVLLLNRNSATVQLPLGISQPQSTSLPRSDLTARVEKAGHIAVEFCAAKLGVSDPTFSAWVFFVILPGLVLLLVLALIGGWRLRPRVTQLPRAR